MPNTAMASAPHDLLQQARSRRQTSSRQLTQPPDTSSPAPSSRTTESWIDVASRDSSASLSSAADEVITHGLRVGASEPQRRRRPLLTNKRPLHLTSDNDGPASAAGSSQDEYTESESESDRIMTSSTEAVSPGNNSEAQSRTHSDLAAGDDEDVDENATTLGTRNRDEACFTPQPNAFSHPPTSQTTRLDQGPGSYFPANRQTASRSASRRTSYPAQKSRPTHCISPSHQPDHDAALRASLNTLLSCAAAARGISKLDESNRAKDTKQSAPTSQARQKSNPARLDPSSLQIIQGPPKPLSNSSRPRQPSSSPSRASSVSDKGKRKASRSNSKDRRSSKRLRSVGADQAISPTLLTWMVSAGVLVLVSALSFSAGVSVGRKAEKLQANGWPGLESLNDGTRRGSRSGLGLRRRLFNGAVRAVAA